MVFNTGAALLDAIVLSVVSKDVEGTYGYRITQDVREVIEISDSTLYPVLRRLQKEECLEVYDMAIDGRNRRYYKITEKGRVQLNLYRGEWAVYSEKIGRILEETWRMNKEEFMTRLKELLADLPDDENKQDALNYYQDYLEEAGENTAAVLKEFGSPERIASMIRCDLNGELNEGGDFTDHGIEDTRFKEPGYDVAKRLDLPEVMEEETAKQGQEKEPFHTDNTS